jgi:Domain of unknown function (DUF4362)
MRNLLIIAMVLVLAGCQLFADQVVSKHGKYENLQALDEFALDVEKSRDAELQFVEYGIEGQRGVREFEYNEDSGINVNYSVDGEQISTYTCEGFILKKDDFAKRYILTDCSERGDEELLVLYAK